MRFKDRYTQRNCVDNEYIYYSKRDLQDVFRQLGYYEDIGYSPEELTDVLIDAELSKARAEWDLDNLEKWQNLKNRITKIPPDNFDGKY